MATRSHSGSTDLRALAGVIAAGLLLGGVASVMLRSAGELMDPGTAEAAATAKTTAAAKPAAAGAGVAGVKPGRTAKPAAPAAKPGVASVGGAVVVTPARVDQSLAYQYNALGRRDPFQSLLSGEYVGEDLGGGAPPDLGGLKVVGVVWGDADQFALVEDARGDSHILRRGDKVMNGFVEKLLRDAMVVTLTVDGQSQSVKIPITRKGDNSNGNR